MESLSKVVTLTVVVLAASVSAQDIVSDCPVPNGYFADSIQCDKYYECVDNVLTEKLCPDGMAFNDANHKVEKCDFIYQTDCANRPELQPAQPTENCPRQNGYFAHSTPGKCSEFYYCAGGNGNHLNCPESLVFSLKTGTCVWADEAGRTDECTGANVVNFTCPTVPAREAVAHPRYADPDDCQYFYVCINGKTPRRNGCKFGEVFNSELRACDAPKTVPECADYYFDFFTDFFANLGTEVPKREIINAAKESGFPIPEVARKIRVRPSSDGPRKRGPVTSSKVVERIPARGHGDTETRQPPRRRRPVARPAPPPTTTAPPPPPPQLEAEGDYVYYDEYYEDPALVAQPPVTAAPRLSPSRLLSRNRPTG